jgi:DNA polymerase III epsilon subunit-like protein
MKKTLRPRAKPKRLRLSYHRVKRRVEPSLAVVFDTETTGLVDNRTLALDRQPEIIEFYACVADLSTGKIKREVDVLIRPSKMPLPPKITQITGITDAMLDGKPSFREIAKGVTAILAATPLVIAHNASFDKDVVEIELQRLGKSLTWPRLLCTVEATVGLRGYRLDLSSLYELLFNKKFAGAHRARHDVGALVEIAVELRRREMI